MNNCISTAIKLKALTKIYNTEDGSPLKAIDNLSLTVPQGRVFGFLGAAGAGKTTLVKLLGGLTTPTTGQISLNGYTLTPTRPVTVEQVGLVLAEAWPEEKCKYWTTSLRQKLLTRKGPDYVGLEEPDNIRRLIDLAYVLKADPPIVILDEPLADLEPQLAQIVKNWLTKLVSQQNKTIVLATQYPDLVEELCDEVAILKQGRLMIQQPVAQLLQCSQAVAYQITVQGHLPRHWSSWFDNLTMTHTEQGETILSGVIIDQAALHGVLARVRDLALPLLSVLRTKPSLANIMQSLKQAD